jgi:hypothetical protein
VLLYRRSGCFDYVYRFPRNCHSLLPMNTEITIILLMSNPTRCKATSAVVPPQCQLLTPVVVVHS